MAKVSAYGARPLPGPNVTQKLLSNTPTPPPPGGEGSACDIQPGVHLGGPPARRPPGGEGSACDIQWKAVPGSGPHAGLPAGTEGRRFPPEREVYTGVSDNNGVSTR